MLGRWEKEDKVREWRDEGVGSGLDADVDYGVCFGAGQWHPIWSSIWYPALPFPVLSCPVFSWQTGLYGAVLTVFTWTTCEQTKLLQTNI